MSDGNGISPPRLFISKGWGFEDVLVNKDEYCGKLLFFKKGKKCSWHVHKIKDETFYVQSGSLLVHYNNGNDCVQRNGTLNTHMMFHIVLDAGDTFHVPPGMYHRMTGLTDCYMFEFSTTHVEEDSIRVVKGD